jgi:hypothetical protein
MADHLVDDMPAYVEQPRRRFGVYVLLALMLLAFGYWLSPYVAAVSFALAVQSGSSEAVTARIDLASLRNNFARQIVRAYAARNPQTKSLDPLARQAVSGVAAGYVSGIISDYLTPEAIAELLRQGRSSARAGELLGQGVPLPRIDGLRQAWQLFAVSGFASPTSFSVEPASATGGKGYRLIFGLDGAGWPLKAVDLPEETLGRFADELSARIERKS